MAWTNYLINGDAICLNRQSIDKIGPAAHNRIEVCNRQFVNNIEENNKSIVMEMYLQYYRVITWATQLVIILKVDDRPLTAAKKNMLEILKKKHPTLKLVNHNFKGLDSIVVLDIY